MSEYVPFDWSPYKRLIEIGEARQHLTDLHHALKYEERAIAASERAEAEGTIEAHTEAMLAHHAAAHLHERCKIAEKAAHHHERRSHHTARLTELHARKT